MKNQYFGDINDYRKYGVLRCLAETGRFTAGVCWMLTPSDETTHGSFTQYLDRPEKWRHFDPPLFDALARAVTSGSRRGIFLTKQFDQLPGAIDFNSLVPAGPVGRSSFIAACLGRVADCDLVFFDPDNGIEVKSVPYGSKASPKYVYWRELAAAFHEGHSLLVYQHYPRQKRTSFHSKLAREFKERLRPEGLWAQATSTVVYFFAVQAEHLPRARATVEAIQDRWAREVEVIGLLDA